MMCRQASLHFYLQVLDCRQSIALELLKACCQFCHTAWHGMALQCIVLDYKGCKVMSACQASLQEMFAEYWRGYSECDAKQSFRMTVMLFEAFDPDDYEDAEAAWQTTRYAQESRRQERRNCFAVLLCPQLIMHACMTYSFQCRQVTLTSWLSHGLNCTVSTLCNPSHGQPCMPGLPGRYARSCSNDFCCQRDLHCQIYDIRQRHITLHSATTEKADNNACSISYPHLH